MGAFSKPVEHLFSTMLQQQEQHGGKQGSPNGGDQSLLARVVALEQEKREAVLRAELERAARQAERKEQETARRIERLEQARALDAAKAEQARTSEAPFRLLIQTSACVLTCWKSCHSQIQLLP